MQAGTRTGAHWQRRHDYLIYMNNVYEQAALVAGLLLLPGTVRIAYWSYSSSRVRDCARHNPIARLPHVLASVPSLGIFREGNISQA
jgi:hypothetical protein